MIELWIWTIALILIIIELAFLTKYLSVIAASLMITGYVAFLGGSLPLLIISATGFMYVGFLWISCNKIRYVENKTLMEKFKFDIGRQVTIINWIDNSSALISIRGEEFIARVDCSNNNIVVNSSIWRITAITSSHIVISQSKI